MKSVLVISSHKLFDEQLKLLKGFSEEIELIQPNPKGWTEKDMRDLVSQMKEEKVDSVIFVSPIPLLMKLVSETNIKFYVMHNDKRNKIEKVDGKTISIPPKDGWKLL